MNLTSERGSERGERTLARALHRSSVLNWDTELAFGSKPVHEHTLQPTRVVKPFETLNRNETVGYRFEECNGYGVMASVSNSSLHGFRDFAVWNVIKRRWRTRIGTLQGSDELLTPPNPVRYFYADINLCREMNNREVYAKWPAMSTGPQKWKTFASTKQILMSISLSFRAPACRMSTYQAFTTMPNSWIVSNS